MVVHCLVYLDVIISGSLSCAVVLWVYCCYLIYTYLLLFEIRIERGAPASSISLVVLNSSRVIQTRLVVFKLVSWYLNPSRGIQIRLVVFKSFSWYSNSSRGNEIRLMVFKFVFVVYKSVSWYSNSSRGNQIRLMVFKFVFVVFKSVSWYSNSSRGNQIRLRGIQIRLACKVNSLRLSCG